MTGLRAELADYVDVLLGRQEPPVNTGESTLAEISNAYYSRAREMEMQLHGLELEGHVLKGSGHYRFRTGELRSFIELAKQCYELGSRRITMAQMEYQ